MNIVNWVNSLVALSNTKSIMATGSTTFQITDRVVLGESING